MSDPRLINIRSLPKKGCCTYIIPEGAVRIDRPGPYGNPFVIGSTETPWPGGQPLKHAVLTRAEAVRMFGIWLDARLAVEPDFIEPLRGKTLVCWCAEYVRAGRPMPALDCHGSLYLAFLDRTTT